MLRLDSSIKTQTEIFARSNEKPTFKAIIEDFLKMEKLEKLDPAEIKL